MIQFWYYNRNSFEINDNNIGMFRYRNCPVIGQGHVRQLVLLLSVSTLRRVSRWEPNGFSKQWVTRLRFVRTLTNDIFIRALYLSSVCVTVINSNNIAATRLSDRDAPTQVHKHVSSVFHPYDETIIAFIIL